MNKTWFITGTSSGLGRLLTERALARGDRVFATLRNRRAMEDLQARHPQRLHIHGMELTDPVSIRRAVDSAFGELGRIDVVVSNAGYGLFGAAEELSDLQIERQLATNLTGSIQLVRAVLPYLRRQGGGRIVQVSSEGGQIAYPGFSLYHASKWGIEGFIEAVAQEVSGFGIDFILAEPGPTETRFGASIDHAQPLPDYAETPADQVRRAIGTTDFPRNGDAERTVEIMMHTIDQPQPPFRLVLGSTAYQNIHAALNERLRVLESGRDDAFAADKMA